MEIRLPAAYKVLPKARLNGFDWTVLQGSTKDTGIKKE